MLTAQICPDAFVKVRQHLDDVILRPFKAGCQPIGNNGKAAVDMIADDEGQDMLGITGAKLFR